MSALRVDNLPAGSYSVVTTTAAATSTVALTGRYGFPETYHKLASALAGPVTAWAKEYPCDGLVAVNNAAAGNTVLKQAYKAASDKKTFVWTKEAWKEKSQKVLDSDSRYFLITKNPIDMKEILVDQGFVPGDIKEIIVSTGQRMRLRKRAC